MRSERVRRLMMLGLAALLFAQLVAGAAATSVTIYRYAPSSGDTYSEDVSR